jgi:hypothetical protein
MVKAPPERLPMSAEEAHRLFAYRSDGNLVRRISSGSSKAGSVAGSLKRTGYLQVRFAGGYASVHRVVWLLHFGAVPESLDHINGDRADNRIENLRPATSSQNAQNVTRAYGAIPFKGVTRLPTGRFQVQITKDRETRYVGCFIDVKQAARAYDEAAARMFGEFAKTNAALGLV